MSAWGGVRVSDGSALSGSSAVYVLFTGLNAGESSVVCVTGGNEKGTVWGL